MSWYEWGPTRPREAKGGIRARSKRGGFAESWWGRRWIEVLESFDIGGRLGRGRTYARKGQVLDLTVEPGAVAAKVQGSRPWPYGVEIRMKPLSDAQWRKVAEAVSEDTWSAARLIAGEMPESLEDTFRAAGAPLFPTKLHDLETLCSCPDWSNPCKHVAAAYYLLAESFDTDPFLLLRLRGRSRDDFVALLGGPAETAVPEPPPVPPAPLRADAAAFWQGRPVPADLFGAASLPDGPTVLAATLGPLPFWRGEADFLEGMDAAVNRAATRGRKLAEGS